jgi:hypothetical protein
MTEKAFTGGTDPLVEDLGDGTHIPIVKVRGLSTSGSQATGDALTEAQLLAAGLALDTSVQSTNTSLGTDGATPPPIIGTGVRGWLRAIYERLVAGIGVTGPLTDVQIRASALPVSLDRDAGAGNVTAKTNRVTLASDSQVVTVIGAVADASAATDGTGNYTIISALKRGLLNWATLLVRVPVAITPGLLPVDTLGTPSTPRVQAVGAVAASLALTTTCRRVSMYATQGTWYSISGTATALIPWSHYIAAGERLDFDVPANTTISVLRESLDGSIRITEIV